MVIRLLLILFLILNTGLAQASDEVEKTLIVGSEAEFPPFAIGQTDETADGFTVDLWKEVAKEAGLEYKIRVRPWGQILQEFKEGKIDVLINIAQSEDRYLYTDFSVPHVTVNGAIFVRKGETGIRSEADLADKSIIVFKSDLAHEYAVSRGWQKQLVIVDTPKTAMNLLSSGQHDAVLIGKLAGIQTIRELNLKNIKTVDAKTGYTQKFSFGVHKGDVKQLASLNEALALVKANGTYDTIYQKWFGVYEVKEVSLLDMLKYLLPLIAIFLIAALFFFNKRRLERIKANEYLSSSEEKLRLILDSAGEAIYGTDLHGNCTFCNTACLKMLGYSHQDELLGKDMHTQIHHSYQGGVHFPIEACRLYKALQLGEETHVDDEVLWRSDGTCFASEYWSHPQFKAGKLIGTVVTFIDITERKLAEETLREERQRLATITDSAHDAIIMIDPQGDIVYWNPAAETILGYSADETLGKNLHALLTPSRYLDAHHRAFPHFVRTGQGTAIGKTLELSAIRKDRHEITISLSLSSVLLHGCWHAVGIISDISDLKRAEKEKQALESQLHQSQKLESVGRLAGGVAHDFNNKLMVIIGNAELACMNLNDNTATLDHLHEIIRAAEHSRDIAGQMLAFSRQQVIMPRILNANHLIAETQKSLFRLIGEHISFVFTLADDLWNIKIDPVQLDQIVINLAANARDAMPNGGTFTVETDNVTLDENLCSTINDCVPGEYVRITFRDTGTGIDQETIKHIFEPFFTTKEQGKGTGLGLATTHGIVRQNYGFIEVHSTLGEGSVFRVYLPRHEEKA